MWVTAGDTASDSIDIFSHKKAYKSAWQGRMSWVVLPCTVLSYLHDLGVMKSADKSSYILQIGGHRSS
jgi:hypothetical protein